MIIMIEIVDKFLEEYGLNKSENTFIVGFSGGCDSLCLLDILHGFSKKYGFRVIAAHLNHNWRGEESKQEEINCRNFCEKNEIEYIAETLEYTAQKTEKHAREARYEFFTKIAKNYSNCSIFTAHTRTDNAETLIYRIVKGTGITGLQGIMPKNIMHNYPIFRPLLPVSRKEIEDYCNSKGLVPNTDSSNFDINYKRNYIRHKIMPLFDEINFHAEKSIVSLAKMAISHTNIVNEYMDKVLKDVCAGDKFLTEKFKNLSDDVIKKIIYDICIKADLDYDSKKIEDILEFLKLNFNSKSGSRYSLTNNLWLFVSSKEIYLITKTKASKTEEEVQINSEGEYNFFDKAFSLEQCSGKSPIEFPSENASYAYINLSEVGTNLTLRTRREGDYITPFGMEGSMKLKKYLNSKGISQHEKDNLILLCKGQEVLWIAGVGLSNKLRVKNIENEPVHVIELKNKG